LKRAQALFGDRPLVELVGTIAAYNMVARFLEALGIDERGE
jgi:alkylhydroperoxidase family enzyme